MKKSILIKNTLIIIITGFIVKIIGMVGKIFTTRILGLEGMSLYILSYPTLLLFINISGFSLNNSISKLTSEAIVTKKYSPKKILIEGIKISLVISGLCIIIYGSTIYSISKTLLKNESLFFPLLSGIVLIPLVGASDALRGYFNGIKKMNHASTSLFLEQLFRTTCSIIGVYIGIKYNIILANCLLIISLSIGEIASISYCLIILKKQKIIHFENTEKELNAVFKMSSTLTLSKLIGSITFFLEPIIYTWILTKEHYIPTDIHHIYTEIDAFTIPLLTFISFLPFSLSTAIIPHISEEYAKENYNNLNYYIHKALNLVFYPSIICLIFIFFYHNELMLLLFKTTNGALLAKQFCFFFIFYYFQAIITSILQAIGKIKPLFINSALQNLLRIILIVILSKITKIGPYSIIYATTICLISSFITLFIIMKKETQFKLNTNNLFLMSIISMLTFFTIKLLTLFSVNYITVICFITIIYLLILIKFLKKK